MISKYHQKLQLNLGKLKCRRHVPKETQRAYRPELHAESGQRKFG